MSERFTIEVGDPRRHDVKALLERHLAFSHAMTPLEHSFALDVDALLDRTVTLFALRQEGGSTSTSGS